MAKSREKPSPNAIASLRTNSSIIVWLFAKDPPNIMRNIKFLIVFSPWHFFFMKKRKTKNGKNSLLAQTNLLTKPIHNIRCHKNERMQNCVQCWSYCCGWFAFDMGKKKHLGKCVFLCSFPCSSVQIRGGEFSELLLHVQFLLRFI